MTTEANGMLTLSSKSFRPSEEMSQKYGKKAQNVSPQLAWTEVPPGTKSFALAMVDRHPVARGFVHWLVTDIGADITALREDAAHGGMPAGSQEVKPYAGPFPPSGTHDYEFTLYALDAEKVDVPSKAGLDAFMDAVAPHTVGMAKLVGKFTKGGS